MVLVIALVTRQCEAFPLVDTNIRGPLETRDREPTRTWSINSSLLLRLPLFGEMGRRRLGIIKEL